jgi:hypothetical protein
MRLKNLVQVARRASVAAGVPSQSLFTNAPAHPFANELEKPTPPQLVTSLPSPPKMKFEAVPSGEALDKGLKEIESSHELFNLLDQLRQKAVAGTLTRAEFQGLRDSLLAMAHFEPETEKTRELVEILNFVGAACFKLTPKNPADAYAQATETLKTDALRPMQAYVKTVGDLRANKDRAPHLRLAQSMIDGPLTSTLRQIFIAGKGKMSDHEFNEKIAPWLLKNSSDPMHREPMQVQGPAHAQTIQHSVQSIVSATAGVICDSSLALRSLTVPQPV